MGWTTCCQGVSDMRLMCAAAAVGCRPPTPFVTPAGGRGLPAVAHLQHGARPQQLRELALEPVPVLEEPVLVPPVEQVPVATCLPLVLVWDVQVVQAGWYEFER